MKMQVRVLGGNQYSFVDKASGEVIEGKKLLIVSDEQSNNKDSFGFFVSEINVAYSEKVERIGVYEADAQLKNVKNGTKSIPTLVFQNLELIKELEIVE